MFSRSWGDQGRPIVGVHGLVVSGAYFEPLARSLSSQVCLWAPDQPGFGRSQAPEDVPGIPGIARYMIGWLDSQLPGGADVVANSFGCQVAAEIAMRRPDLVRRLALVSPTLDDGARSVGRVLRRWVQESKTQSWAFRRLLAKEYARAGVNRAVRTLQSMLRDRVEEKLPYVQAPTLVVRGTSDPICTEQWARRVFGLLPRAHLVTVTGAPHAMVFDAPDALAEVVRPFLTRSEVRV